MGETTAIPGTAVDVVALRRPSHGRLRCDVGRPSGSEPDASGDEGWERRLVFGLLTASSSETAVAGRELEGEEGRFNPRSRGRGDGGGEELRVAKVADFLRGLGGREDGRSCDWKETCRAGPGGRWIVGSGLLGAALLARSATAFLRLTDLGRERRGAFSTTTGSAGAGRVAGISGANNNTITLCK